MVKCRNCHKEIEKDLAIEYKPKFYVCCEDCLNQKNKSKQNLTQKNDTKKELTEYLNAVLPKPINWIAIHTQIKSYEKRGMTTAGILYTLKYIKNYLDKPIEYLGIVCYYYDEAKRYCIWKNNMKKQIEKMEFGNDSTLEVRKQNNDREENIFE